jgi:hypothetical protein
MPLKTPGDVNPPPSSAEFNKLPLDHWCRDLKGLYFRLHTVNRSTGKLWHPIHFSRRGTTRFDPPTGPGTLYVGETIGGALLEIFDDSWGAVGSASRKLTKAQLNEWWVTLVAVPPIKVFFAHGINLSKIGTDIQLLSGDHGITRAWALRLAEHPLCIDGIYYPSRHHTGTRNLAIFDRKGWKQGRYDKNLVSKLGFKGIDPKGPIVYGPPLLLGKYPGLLRALSSLEVAVLP